MDEMKMRDFHDLLDALLESESRSEFSYWSVQMAQLVSFANYMKTVDRTYAAIYDEWKKARKKIDNVRRMVAA